MPGILDIIGGSSKSRDLPATPIEEAWIEEQARRLDSRRRSPGSQVNVPQEYSALMETMKQPVQPPNRGFLGNALMGFVAGPQAFQIQSEEAQQAQAINNQNKQNRLMLLNKLVEAEDKDDVNSIRQVAQELLAKTKEQDLQIKEMKAKSEAALNEKKGGTEEAKAGKYAMETKVGPARAMAQLLSAGKPSEMEVALAHRGTLTPVSQSAPYKSSIGSLMDIQRGTSPAVAQPPVASQAALPPQAAQVQTLPDDEEAVAEQTKNLNLALKVFMRKFGIADEGDPRIVAFKQALADQGYK